MIPVWLRIRVVKENQKKVRLFFPVIFIWIILFALLITFAPLILIASLILWPFGYGKSLLLLGPRIFSVISSLSGLVVQVEGADNQTYILMK